MNSDREERTATVTWLNDCIRDVRTWLMKNMLKLNDEKKEVILFTSIHRLRSLPNITVTVGEQQLLQSSSVCDLGVIYDQHSMTRHVHLVLTPEEYWENPTVSHPRCNKDTCTCLGNIKTRLL